jgi:RNA polymerase sigma factor (sigma-70 family)
MGGAAKKIVSIAPNIVCGMVTKEFVIGRLSIVIFRGPMRIRSGMDGFEGRSALATWAYRLAVNEALQYRREINRREKALREYGRNVQNVQIEQIGGRGQAQILREFTQSLKDEDQTIFTLYIANVSYQQIAEIAGVTEAYLRLKISRLRDLFEQRYL